jgi:putative ABC transport system permease protein
MGIPLLEGRLADPVNANEVNINQTAARRLFRGESPIGKRVKFGLGAADAPWRTVVGVVGDVHHLGLEIAPRPEVYRPYIANPLGAPVFAVRAKGDPQTLAIAIRERLRAVEPEVPLFNVATMEQRLAQSLQTRRLSVLMLTGFAGVALLLAAIGLYGIIAYGVTQRTREMGVRIAVGATSRDVVSLVMRHALGLVTIGVVAGLAAGAAGSRLVRSWLFATSATDGATFVVVPCLLAIVALVASLVPARRAARVDPIVALRGE